MTVITNEVFTKMYW